MRNTMMEMCFQDPSNAMLQAPKFLKSQLVNPKNICNRLVTAEHACQKNPMENR